MGWTCIAEPGKEMKPFALYIYTVDRPVPVRTEVACFIRTDYNSQEVLAMCFIW
jgi:hypothetical protein